MKRFLIALDRSINFIEKTIISVSVIFMAVLLILNTVTRVLFNNSMSFTQEISKFLLIILTFIGVSFASRIGRHIRMEGIFSLLPYKYQRGLMIFISLATSFIMFLLTYYSYNFVVYEFNLGQVSTVLRLPLYLFIMFMPIGFLLSGIYYLRAFFMNLTHKSKKEIFVSPETQDVSSF